MRHLQILMAFGMLVLAAGCAGEETLIETPSNSTLGDKYYEQSPALNKNINPQDTTLAVSISDTLTFADALAKALLENPQLQSYGWQVRVKEAERLQASLLPNPKLDAEMENFGGTDRFEGLDNREITIRLGQKILLGADRIKRKRLAGYNKKLAGWNYETQRLEVLTGVTKAYISVLAAQRQYQEQQELVEVARELHKSISAQTEAGKVSNLIKTKAQVELSRTQIQLKRTRNHLQTARSNLASFWGSADPSFQVLDGELNAPPSIPRYSDLSELIRRNPDVARWATELKQRESKLAVERAEAIPDPTISGGYKRFEDVGAEAAIVGISVPIPVFDRNQGSIKAAKSNIRRAKSQQEAALAEVHRALQEAYNQMKSAWQELQQMEKDILPGAESTFKGIQTGYRQGKFDYLEVLDAQRTLFSSRTQYIEALAEYNRTVAEIERQIGTPLSEISSQ